MRGSILYCKKVCGREERSKSMTYLDMWCSSKQSLLCFAGSKSNEELPFYFYLSYILYI